MSFFCDSLWAAEIYINRIDLVLKHFCSLYHCLRVVSTNLCHQRPILLASCKVLILVCFICNHHLWVKHRCIAEVSSVLSTQNSERQFGLVNHRSANMQCLLGQEWHIFVQHLKLYFFYNYFNFKPNKNKFK